MLTNICRYLKPFEMYPGIMVHSLRKGICNVNLSFELTVCFDL